MILDRNFRGSGSSIEASNNAFCHPTVHGVRCTASAHAPDRPTAEDQVAFCGEQHQWLAKFVCLFHVSL